jgi:hypothetical protein
MIKKNHSVHIAATYNESTKKYITKTGETRTTLPKMILKHDGSEYFILQL